MNTVLSAVLPHRIASRTSTTFVLISIGAVLIAAMTQVRIPLPFTPVPITGQTFAVILWAMVAGRKVGVASVAAYLFAGALGAPIFSGFASITALWGPTSGYLLGFLPAAFVAGAFAEKINSRSAVLRAVHYAFTCITAIAIIHLCGAMVLTAFVGIDNVWSMGVAPFLVVDVIKTLAITSILTTIRRK